ncbi:MULTISPECIES: hypothetical protein [unclassified Microbacterium]|uniref:hypothetical protein n=1 Tax=unclassified Microbacterium TaxID=2609290 RepID=UPI002882E40D|nr:MULTISPECIES: hypothetical protein [unclassified Microbacterium]
MRIGRTSYTAEGELMMPRALDVKLATNVASDVTLDVGYYHLVRLSASNARELGALRQRFINTLATAPTGSVLKVRDYEVRMDSFHTVNVELIYVVEPPVSERRTMTPQDYLMDSLTQYQR